MMLLALLVLVLGVAFVSFVRAVWRRPRPAPLGYVRLADRYYHDRRGYQPDDE